MISIPMTLKFRPTKFNKSNTNAYIFALNIASLLSKEFVAIVTVLWYKIKVSQIALKHNWFKAEIYNIYIF